VLFLCLCVSSIVSSGSPMSSLYFTLDTHPSILFLWWSIYKYNHFLYIHVTHLHKYLYYSSDFRFINEAYCKDFDIGNCHHCVMGWPSTNFCHSTKSYLVGGSHVIASFTFNFLIWFLVQYCFGERELFCIQSYDMHYTSMRTYNVHVDSLPKGIAGRWIQT
jgi:hypothetical protein